MEKKENRSSKMLVPGMTLALFALQAVLMGTKLAYAGTLLQTLALSALFALVYGAFMLVFDHLEKPRVGTMLFVGAFAAVRIDWRGN